MYLWFGDYAGTMQAINNCLFQFGGIHIGCRIAKERKHQVIWSGYWVSPYNFVYAAAYAVAHYCRLANLAAYNHRQPVATTPSIKHVAQTNVCTAHNLALVKHEL